MYGNPTAKFSKAGTTWVANNDWRPLHTGSAPLSGRQWIYLQVKSRTAVGIQFVNVASDGTFSAPAAAQGVNNHVILPANSIHVFPVGDGVAIYGRSATKVGSSATGGLVAFTEFK